MRLAFALSEGSSAIIQPTVYRNRCSLRSLCIKLSNVAGSTRAPCPDSIHAFHMFEQAQFESSAAASHMRYGNVVRSTRNTRHRIHSAGPPERLLSSPVSSSDTDIFVPVSVVHLNFLRASTRPGMAQGPMTRITPNQQMRRRIAPVVVRYQC